MQTSPSPNTHKKKTHTPGKTRKKTRGTQALREIRKMQKGTKLLIPKATFRRLVKELAAEKSKIERFTPDALRALQEATEACTVGMFVHFQHFAIHAHRSTIMCKDVYVFGDVHNEPAGFVGATSQFEMKSNGPKNDTSVKKKSEDAFSFTRSVHKLRKVFTGGAKQPKHP